MAHFDADSAIAFALNRLSNELSPDLIYHSLWHTKHDVLPAVDRLARLSGLPDIEGKLLRTAAAFHDLGFVETYLQHEQRSADLAVEVLPRYGFSTAQVSIVQQMILATSRNQAPQNLLESLLADADLDYLGRPDFLKRNEELRQELGLRGKNVSSLVLWRIDQLRFLESHVYFTSAARALRQAAKEANMVLLRRFLRMKGYAFDPTVDHTGFV